MILGFYVGKEHYRIFDSPRDGSCFYHCFSSMLQPHLTEGTPSALPLKAILEEFYVQGQ